MRITVLVENTSTLIAMIIISLKNLFVNISITQLYISIAY